MAQELPVAVADRRVHDPPQCGLTITGTVFDGLSDQMLEPLNGASMQPGLVLPLCAEHIDQIVPDDLLAQVGCLFPSHPERLRRAEPVSVLEEIGNRVLVERIHQSALQIIKLECQYTDF